MMIFGREGLWGMDRDGLVMDSGIHHIDLMKAICGDVEWVCDHGGPPFSPLEDPFDGTLSYAHGWTAAGANCSTIVQGYRDEMARLFSCLERRTRPAPNLWDRYRAMQLVEAINRSSTTGERVRVE